MRYAECGSSVADPCSAGIGNSTAADELESIRFPASSRDSLLHVGSGFRQGQRVTIGALDDRLASRPIIKFLDPEDVPSLVTSRLAMPNQVAPACANVVRKNKAFKLNAAVVFKVNRVNDAHHRHQAACAEGGETSGCTASRIPMAFRIAVRLFKAGLPLGESVR